MMNCPSCGTVMVWINGSVLHDPPEKLYECRICQIAVVKHPDGDYDVTPLNQQNQTP